MKTQLLFEVFKTISPLLTLLLVWIKIKLLQWLDTKIKDQRLKNTINKIDGIIQDVVKDVEQSYVQREKASVSSKTLSPDSAHYAKSLAMEKVVDQLGQAGLKEITKSLGLNKDKVDNLLSSKIESKIFDLRHTIPVVMLSLLFSMSISCASIKPITTTATIIKTQEDMVRLGDERVASWFLDQHKVCLEKGIKIRDDLIIDNTPEAEARAKGLVIYNGCIESPINKALKITEIIDLIRSKDKVAAGIALAVARKEKPIEALGYVLPDVLDLVKKLQELLKEYEVR